MKKVLQLLTLTTLFATSLSAVSIHEAVIRNNRAEIEGLIKENPALVNAKGDYGWTPLHYSAFNGHTEMVRILLAHGADVNARNDRNATPLHFASLGGNTDIVGLLLEAGADVDARNGNNNTPLDIARRGARLNIARRQNYTAIINLFATIPLLKSLRDFSASEIITVQ